MNRKGLSREAYIPNSGKEGGFFGKEVIHEISPNSPFREEGFDGFYD